MALAVVSEPGEGEGEGPEAVDRDLPLLAFEGDGQLRATSRRLDKKDCVSSFSGLWMVP